MEVSDILISTYSWRAVVIARSRILPNTLILPVFADNGYPDIIWEIDRNSEKEIYIEREREEEREGERGRGREGVRERGREREEEYTEKESKTENQRKIKIKIEKQTDGWTEGDEIPQME